jgi:hypothetical protein
VVVAFKIQRIGMRVDELMQQYLFGKAKVGKLQLEWVDRSQIPMDDMRYFFVYDNKLLWCLVTRDFFQCRVKSLLKPTLFSVFDFQHL